MKEDSIARRDDLGKGPEELYRSTTWYVEEGKEWWRAIAAFWAKGHMGCVYRVRRILDAVGLRLTVLDGSRIVDRRGFVLLALEA